MGRTSYKSRPFPVSAVWCTRDKNTAIPKMERSNMATSRASYSRQAVQYYIRDDHLAPSRVGRIPSERVPSMLEYLNDPHVLVTHCSTLVVLCCFLVAAVVALVPAFRVHLDLLNLRV